MRTFTGDDGDPGDVMVLANAYSMYVRSGVTVTGESVWANWLPLGGKRGLLRVLWSELVARGIWIEVVE